MSNELLEPAVSADYREATARDVDAIASLHADSWRRHYRGAYSDSFLDSDVFSDRHDVWTERLQRRDRSNEYTILNADAQWGALLDNLHVRHDLKGGGIGTRLMAGTARAVLDRTPSAGLFLWVLEGNKAAQAFYQARGGKCVASKTSEAPGGGTIVAFRYAWPDPSILLAHQSSR